MKNLIGKTINQYQILLKIRETGTRVLFKVYDMVTRRNLALEVVKTDANVDYAELFQLLNKQALENAKLIQPNIAVLIDAGLFENIPYFVYNFCPLQSLRRLFNQKFSWRDSAQALVAITQAVAYAHENGVIHGALSPTSIVLDENKIPYLFDFGFEEIALRYIIAHIPGAWINNSDFAYSSPEQLTGVDVDARSDIYSMGLILYEWMTGDIVLLDETVLATLYKRKTATQKNIDLGKISPAEVQAILQKCIAANPADRYQRMEELSVLLARGAFDLKITTRMVTQPLTTPLITNSFNARRKRLLAFIILGLFVIVLWQFYLTNAGFAQPLPSPTFAPSATARLLPTGTIEKPTSLPDQPTHIPTQGLKPTQVPNKISYPVLEGTALPLSLATIAPENSTRLVTLSRWGIGELNSLVLSPNGSWLAAASPLGVFIYKYEGLTLLKYLDTSSWVSAVVFSSDNQKLAIGDRDGLITVWDTATWQEMEHHSGHKAGILDLDFSPDGTELASIAADNQLLLWNATSKLASVAVRDVTNLIYSADGTQLITGGNDFKINVWNAKDLSLVKTITYSAKIVDLQPLHNSKNVLVGGSDRSVVWLNIETAEKSRPFSGLPQNLSRVAMAPDGSKIAAADTLGGILVWSQEAAQLWKAPTRVEGFAPSENALGASHSLAFSVDGKTLVSGLRNGTVRLFDAATGQLIRQDEALNNRAQRLAVSHNSKFVLSQNSNNMVKMWDLNNGRALFQVPGTMKTGGVFSLNDQYFALAIDASTVKVYRTDNGSEVFTFNGLQAIQIIQFVQDDRFVAVGSDPLGRLWSMTSGQEMKTTTTFNGTGCTAISDLKSEPIFLITKYNYVPTGYDQAPFCTFKKIEWMKAFAINEINKNIAYGGNSKLGFIGPGSNDQQMEDVNFRIIEKVALNAGKTLLAAAFDDHTIGIWSTGTKKMIMHLYGPDNSVTDLQFTPDGKFLLSASLDGTIRVWGIP
jgi:WD40 repeat protein/serine/threonine protein kinase